MQNKSYSNNSQPRSQKSQPLLVEVYLRILQDKFSQNKKKKIDIGLCRGQTVLHREKSKHSDLSLQAIIEIKYEDN